MFNYASLTKKGATLKARAVAGEKITFTRMEYGSGIPAGVDTSKTSDEIKAILAERTSLVSKKADFGMYKYRVRDNYLELTAKIIVSSITEDFYAKELGVYARIGDEEEVLVAYFVETLNPYLIKKEDLVGQEYQIVPLLVFGNAQNIEIEYSPDVYATKEEFDAFVTSNEEEHNEIRQSISDLSNTAMENLQLAVAGEKQLRESADANLEDLISDEATARTNADTALQKSISDLEASFDDKLGNIDISGSLRKTLQFDHVVDSDETLLEWANCINKSMKSVLVKAGTYSLSGKMINLVSTGTKFIFAENGNQINITAYDRGIGATADYGAVVIGLNVKVTNSTYSSGEIDGVFYRGMTCINCTGTGDSSGNIEGIFNQCSCIDCKASATATGTSTDYYSCKGLMAFSFDESTATLTITTD